MLLLLVVYARALPEAACSTIAGEGRRWGSLRNLDVVYLGRETRPLGNAASRARTECT